MKMNDWKRCFHFGREEKKVRHGDGEGEGDDAVPNYDRHTSTNQNTNSCLDKLASPAAILMATLAMTGILVAGLWYFPTNFERYDGNDIDETGLVFQNSKLLYAANIALFFSVIYPFFDLTLDTIWLYLYPLTKKSDPANVSNVFELKNIDYMIKTFLAERWMVVLYSIIVPSITLIYMDPSRNPRTLAYILLGNMDIFPFLANGCLLSIFRQSLKSCTTKITILIWISLFSLTVVYIWSHSIALRASMCVLTMLTMSYPIILTFMEHYNKNKRNVESLPCEISDDINYTIFELDYLAAYSLMLLFSFAKNFSGIAPQSITSEDGTYSLRGFVLLGFATAFAVPILALLLYSPKRLCRQWQEEKIKVLYKHSVQLLEELLPRKGEG